MVRGESSGSEPGWALTSATQVTRDPLNSRWSSFSTAVLRSLAVSNSTNLVIVSMELAWGLSLEFGNPPSALFAACLRVYHVQSGLAGKVFQVLDNVR